MIFNFIFIILLLISTIALCGVVFLIFIRHLFIRQGQVPERRLDLAPVLYSNEHTVPNRRIATQAYANRFSPAGGGLRNELWSRFTEQDARNTLSEGMEELKSLDEEAVSNTSFNRGSEASQYTSSLHQEETVPEDASSFHEDSSQLRDEVSESIHVSNIEFNSVLEKSQDIISLHNIDDKSFLYETKEVFSTEEGVDTEMQEREIINKLVHLDTIDDRLEVEEKILNSMPTSPSPSPTPSSVSHSVPPPPPGLTSNQSSSPENIPSPQIYREVIKSSRTHPTKNNTKEKKKKKKLFQTTKNAQVTKRKYQKMSPSMVDTDAIPTKKSMKSRRKSEIATLEDSSLEEVNMDTMFGMSFCMFEMSSSSQIPGEAYQQTEEAQLEDQTKDFADTRQKFTDIRSPLCLEFDFVYPTLHKEKKSFQSTLKASRATKYSGLVHCKYCYIEQMRYGDSIHCIRCGLPLTMFIHFKPEDRFCLVCAVMNKTDTDKKGRCTIHPVSEKIQDKGSIFVLYRTHFVVGSATKRKKKSEASECLNILLLDDVWKLNQIIRYTLFQHIENLVDNPYNSEIANECLIRVNNTLKCISTNYTFDFTAYKLNVGTLKDFNQDLQNEFISSLTEMLTVLHDVLQHYTYLLDNIGVEEVRKICITQVNKMNNIDKSLEVYEEGQLYSHKRKRSSKDTGINPNSSYQHENCRLEGLHEATTHECDDSSQNPSQKSTSIGEQDIPFYFPEFLEQSQDSFYSDKSFQSSYPSTYNHHLFPYQNVNLNDIGNPHQSNQNMTSIPIDTQQINFTDSAFMPTDRQFTTEEYIHAGFINDVFNDTSKAENSDEYHLTSTFELGMEQQSNLNVSNQMYDRYIETDQANNMNLITEGIDLPEEEIKLSYFEGDLPTPEIFGVDYFFPEYDVTNIDTNPMLE